MKVALWPLRLVTTNREASPQEAASQFIECIKRDYGARQPDFFRGPFQRAAQQAQREKKYLIVYIHSPLHEDTPAFCRQTLTAETFGVYTCTHTRTHSTHTPHRPMQHSRQAGPSFVSHDFTPIPPSSRVVAFANDSALVWGGSVQQSDAYALSSKLETTCFPFLALIACQGRSLEVLCRLEGTLTVEQVRVCVCACVCVWVCVCVCACVCACVCPKAGHACMRRVGTACAGDGPHDCGHGAAPGGAGAAGRAAAPARRAHPAAGGAEQGVPGECARWLVCLCLCHVACNACRGSSVAPASWPLGCSGLLAPVYALSSLPRLSPTPHTTPAHTTPPHT
jgi:hypothetical protein